MHVVAGRRRIAVALATCLVALGVRAAAAPACSFGTMTMFEQFDAATDVALVDAEHASGGERFAEASVVQRFKGPQAATLSIDLDPCWRLVHRGTALVFLRDRSPIWRTGVTPDPSPEQLAVLLEWMVASNQTDADRARVLVAVLTGQHPEALRFDAAFYLSNQPGLIRGLTAPQVEAIAALHGRSELGPLPLVIVARHHGAAWKRLRRDRAVRHDEALRALASYDYERITDAARLATIIAAGRSKPRQRIAAFERCERVQGVALTRFGTFPSDRDEWRRYADACRSGEPLP